MENDDPIICLLEDEYKLTIEEYSLLYDFYVTNSLAKDYSINERTLKDYGWNAESLSNKAYKEELNKYYTLYGEKRNKNNIYIEEANDQLELDNDYNALNLNKQFITIKNTFNEEKIIIEKDSPKGSLIELFFSKIRNSLAHGSYRLIINEYGEKMVFFENENSKNDTNGYTKIKSRMILKLEKLLDIIRMTDKNSLIKKDFYQSEKASNNKRNKEIIQIKEPVIV